MKAKPTQPDQLRMKAADFDAMMRKALGASPKDADEAKAKEAKPRKKPKVS